MILQGRPKRRGVGDVDESGYDSATSGSSTSSMDYGGSIGYGSAYGSAPPSSGGSIGYGSAYGSAPPPSSGSANWLSQLFAPLTKSATQLLTTRYGVPQLNAGQSIVTGPGGTQLYQQPNGALVQPGSLPLLGVGGGGSSTLLLVALGVGALIFAMKR